MNKFLLATALFIPAISFATAEEVNTTQSAIDPRGTCKVFTTTALIPNTWKHVDSCDNYASAVIGASPEEVLKRRWARKMEALDVKAKAAAEVIKKKPVLGRSRLGSGTLTRGGADRVVSLGEEKRATRTSTVRNYGTSKKYLLNDPRRITKSAEQWTERRTSRSGITSGSATEMKRTGALSSSFWSTESARRNERFDAQESNEGWEKYLDNRQYLAKQGRVEKKEYVYKGVSLRRIYRGTRLEGSLEGELLDD